MRKFEERQVRYVRYLPDKSNRKYLNWQHVYNTDDREVSSLIFSPFPMFSIFCCLLCMMISLSSRAPVARRAAKRSTITIGTEPQACIEIENHATLFFLVNIARSMHHRRVHHTMTSTSRNTAAIPQLTVRPRHAVLICSVHL